MNEVGLSLLRTLQEQRTPALDTFFLRLTLTGEGMWLLSAVAVLFWVFGARWAYRAALALAAGYVVTGLLKNLFCIPRPWIRDPDIRPVRAAIRGAWGYSFPSGHTANATTLWGGVAVAARRRWLWIPVLALIGLVGISRVYLGVHTPLDVVVSWVLGAGIVWAAAWAVDRTEQYPRQRWIVLTGIALLAVAAGLLLRWRPVPDDAGRGFGLDLYRSLATMLGFLAAWHIERTYIRFDPARLGAYRIVAVAVGLLVLSLMQTHLRPLLAPWLGPDASTYATVAAAPLWIFVAWPLLLRPLESASK